MHYRIITSKQFPLSVQKLANWQKNNNFKTWVETPSTAHNKKNKQRLRFGPFFSFFSDLWSLLYVYSIIEVVFNNIISLIRQHLGQQLLKNITHKIRCRDTQFSRKIHSKDQYPRTCSKWQVNYNFSRFNLKISSLSNYFRSTIAWTDFRKHYTVTVRWWRTNSFVR